MANISSYRDLLVWQRSMGLVTEVYKITSQYSVSEQYGLTNQTRRSAVSIPSNIAEGFGRNSTSDYIRFLKIASGSLYEVQTQLEIAHNLKYFDKVKLDDIMQKSDEIGKMLSSLIRKIELSKK